jgi:hypothetical protein
MTPHVLPDIVDDWQAHAIEEHRWLAATDRLREAAVCAARALERLHRDLGAPPAIDPWVEALDADLARSGSDDPLVEPALFAAGLAVLGRRPRHPALPLWHARALAFLDRRNTSDDDVVAAARFAFEYAVRAGNFVQAREIVAGTRARSMGASSVIRGEWLEAEALEAWLSGDHARARRAVRDAVAAGAGYGAWEQGASAAIAEGDLVEAGRCLDAMARTIDGRRTQDVAHMHFLAAARMRLAGDDAQACRELATCLAQDRRNVPAYFATLWQLGQSHLHTAAGRYRAAAAILAVVVARATAHFWLFLLFSALLGRTWLRIRQGRANDASDDLVRALALAEVGDYRNCDPWRDPQAIDEIGRLARNLGRASPTLVALLRLEE